MFGKKSENSRVTVTLFNHKCIKEHIQESHTLCYIGFQETWLCTHSSQTQWQSLATVAEKCSSFAEMLVLPCRPECFIPLALAPIAPFPKSHSLKALGLVHVQDGSSHIYLHSDGNASKSLWWGTLAYVIKWIQLLVACQPYSYVYCDMHPCSNYRNNGFLAKQGWYCQRQHIIASSNFAHHGKSKLSHMKTCDQWGSHFCCLH